MKSNFQIAFQAFCYFFGVLGICFSVGFFIVSGKLVESFTFGCLGGILASFIMSIYLFVGLLLFQKKLFLYNNIKITLKKLGANNVRHESVAGNASGYKIVYGGLFLTDNSVIFLTHRFSFLQKFQLL